MKDQAFIELIHFEGLQKLDEDQFNLPFSINRESSVFDGHFPDQPILPGVVMIEITKRAAEVALGKELSLVSAGNFKFLKMVDPNLIKNADLNFSLVTKDDGWRVKAQIKFEEEIYFKADAFYRGR